MKFYQFSRIRIGVCRHCGQEFTTEFPAQKTCKRAECIAWSKELRKQQSSKWKKNHDKLKRKSKVEK